MTFSIFDATVISLVAPVWKMENAVIRTFNPQDTLIAENAMLRERIFSLEAELVSLQTGRRPESNMVTAAVLTHPPQTPYDSIIIDAGSNESIGLDSEVLLPDGSAFGVVSQVFAKQSRVKLYSTAGEETNAVLERGNVPVVLVGSGGGNFKIILPRDVVVMVGDRVLTPYTSARLLAVVEEIVIGSTDSFQEVLARSPANIFTLRFVFVTR